MTNLAPMQNNLLGIGFILMTGVTMTISALLIRIIGKDLGSFEVVFIRSLFSLFYIMLLSARDLPGLVKSPRPFMMASRSLVLAGMVLGNFYAIVHLPLVQVTALQFTKPLFLVILAMVFLSEKIHIPRTVATVVGFVGVLIILRPDGNGDPAQIVALISAVSMAAVAVVTKKMTRDHSAKSILFCGNFFIMLCCLGPTIAYWQTPNLYQVALIAGLGLSAYAGQHLMVQAYRYGETTAVTPFEYVRILFMGLAGFALFGEIPDVWTLIGAAIICTTTLFIALRETRKKHPPQTPL